MRSLDLSYNGKNGCRMSIFRITCYDSRDRSLTHLLQTFSFHDSAAMGFVPFQLEEWQSKFETTVKFNLADSGCHPAELGALLPSPSDQEKLLSLSMHYPPVGERYKGFLRIT